MTKTQLRDSIKYEARITTSSSNLDDLIFNLIDEVLADLTAKNRNFELLVPEHQIATASATGYVATPADFRFIQSVRFVTQAGVKYTLEKTNQFTNQLFSNGIPRWYFMAGTDIRFWPYSSVTANDKIEIDYYKKIAFGASDEFPVPILESSVRKSVLSRLARYHKEAQQDQAFVADSADSPKVSTNDNEQGV